MFDVFDKHRHDLKPISLALQKDKDHKIRIYKELMDDKYYYVILTNDYDWRLSRQIIALMPHLFHTLIVPPEVKEMLKYFGTDKYEEWVTTLTIYLASLNLTKKKFKIIMHNFLIEKEDQQKYVIQQNIEGKQLNIKDYTANLETALKDLTTLNQKLLGLMTQPKTDTEDVEEYVAKHPYISDISIRNSSTLLITLETPIVYFDVEVLKAYYKKTDTLVTIDNDIARLFDEVFIKENYILYTTSKVSLDFANYRIDKYDADFESPQYLKQPHIMRYNCWGNNKPIIMRLLHELNYIGSIEQVIAAVQNLNFVDTTVLNHFIDVLRNNKNKKSFKNVKNNDFYSYKDITNILKEQDRLEEAKLNEINKSNGIPTPKDNGTVSELPEF
jgi:hypothetical protein